MNIIFLGTTGIYHTLIAAQLFLNQEQANDLEKISYHDLYLRELSGFPIYVGSTEEGQRVYTLGGGREVILLKKSIEDLRELSGFTQQDLIIKPLLIKSDKVIFFLYKIAAFPLLRGASKTLINFLLQREKTVIQQKVELFKKQLH